MDPCRCSQPRQAGAEKLLVHHLMTPSRSQPPGPKPPTLVSRAAFSQPGVQDTSHTASSQCKVALPRRAPGFGGCPLLQHIRQSCGRKCVGVISHQLYILEHRWAVTDILCKNAKAHSCTCTRYSLFTRSRTHPWGPIRSCRATCASWSQPSSLHHTCFHVREVSQPDCASTAAQPTVRPRLFMEIL